MTSPVLAFSAGVMSFFAGAIATEIKLIITNSPSASLLTGLDNWSRPAAYRLNDAAGSGCHAPRIPSKKTKSERLSTSARHAGSPLPKTRMQFVSRDCLRMLWHEVRSQETRPEWVTAHLETNYF